jgi:hypothetical protein
VSEPEQQPKPVDKPKSMSDFDYFNEDIPLGGIGRGEQSLEALKKRERRLVFHAILIVLVCFLLGTLVHGLRANIAYSFRAQEAQLLGRVDEISPDVPMPHDKLVRLSGITEARAAQVKWIRGLDWRASYRYFHLLGTPVFIELPSDGSQGSVEAFETVELEGRLIDLTRANEYDRLLDFLEDKLRMRRPARPYMLQVGVKPDGGKRAIVLLLVVIAIPAVNIALWLRAWRRLRRRI